MGAVRMRRGTADILKPRVQRSRACRKCPDRRYALDNRYENCSNFLVGVPSFSLPSNILGTYISAADNFDAGTGAALLHRKWIFICHVIFETDIISLMIIPFFSLPVLWVWVELRPRREFWRFYHRKHQNCSLLRRSPVSFTKWYFRYVLFWIHK